MKTLALTVLLAALAAPAYADTVPVTMNGTIVTDNVGNVMLQVKESGSPFTKISYQIVDGPVTAAELGALKGFPVTLYGKMAVIPGPPGTHFIREGFQPLSAQITVKGKLAELYFAGIGIPHPGNMELSSWKARIAVNTGNNNWIAYNYKRVSLTGTLVPASGDVATYFQATSIKGPGDEPEGGFNGSLTSNTTGSAPAGSAPGASGVGTTR